MRVILLALLMTACSAFPTKVDTVYVPVYTPCVTHIAVKPQLTFVDEARDIYFQVKALLVDRIAMQKYEADLEAVVEGCTQAP